MVADAVLVVDLAAVQRLPARAHDEDLGRGRCVERVGQLVVRVSRRRESHVVFRRVGRDGGFGVLGVRVDREERDAALGVRVVELVQLREVGVRQRALGADERDDRGVRPLELLRVGVDDAGVVQESEMAPVEGRWGGGRRGRLRRRRDLMMNGHGARRGGRARGRGSTGSEGRRDRGYDEGEDGEQSAGRHWRGIALAALGAAAPPSK